MLRPWLDDNSGATISDDGVYRTMLWRVWNKRLPMLCIVMLNPSTANAYFNDPTIKRCIGHAASWGYGGIIVVNLCSYRCTKPDKMLLAMRHGVDIVGPHNWSAQIQAFASHNVLVAWGTNVERLPAEIVGACKERLVLASHVWTFDLSFGGHPLHPLYQPSSAKPKRFVL